MTWHGNTGPSDCRSGRILSSVVGRLWAGGLLIGLLLAGGVTVAAIGAVHERQTLDTLTQVVQPLQMANTELRSGFSQCENWYFSYRLMGRGNYLGAFRTCGADFQLTLDSAMRLAHLAHPSLLPLVESQERAAQSWFSLAERDAVVNGRAGPGGLSTPAVNASVSFFAANAVMQQRIDQARDLAARAGQDSLGSELRYGALFVGLVLVALVVGVTLVVRSVVGPLASLGPTLARLASGDHTARTTVRQPAEIAAVARVIDDLAQEGELLIEAEKEHTRLRALAQEAGIRIRANLNANAVVREAVTRLERDLAIDLAFIVPVTDGRLGSPQAYHDAPGHELFGRLRPGDEHWPPGLLQDRLVIQDLHGEPGGRVPPQTRGELLGDGYVSAAFMPVGAGDQPLGVVVGLRRDLNRPWRPAEIDAFEWIAADLGRGLKHAQMYEAEQELVEKFRSLDQVKTDFMANVSHELRTPLTSVAGYVEVLKDGAAGPVSADQHKILDTINRNASRLRSLIEDLLTLSKIEVGTFKTVMHPVRLADVISFPVAAMSPVAEKGDLEIRAEAVGQELTLNGDEGQLDRMMMNLLSNSVKFTPPGGTITVSADRDGAMAIVRVSDTGIGIPEKDKERLFNRFFRGSNAVSAELPGTGLGLSIVRTIVANHGGEMDVQSDEGHGTLVTIRLPLSSEGADAGADRHPEMEALG
ncbi:MAG TPA: ATP-binding protein [Streptosporangiaceae bacterium]|nr:ATP-binding protein [Streptosporangiaceae bacterium]